MTIADPRTLLLVLVALLTLPWAVLAQSDVNVPARPETGPSGAGVAAVAATPHVAEITGNDVYIRSGPGTNFYHCGKLYQGDRVQVVKTQQGWSCIVPPPGCFSWIPMQYVSINLDNPTMGIVTGDDVKVYAGSDYVEPMHSTSKQVTLNRRDNVRLLSEEKDDYYKIAPPQGAYLWVSSQYVQSVQTPVRERPVEVEPTPVAPISEPAPEAPGESDLLDSYYALTKLVKAQQEKPVGEQDYSEVKKKLKELAENEAAGKAARYAEFTLKQVERFELAGTVAKEIELQNKELEKVTDKIDEARATRLAQIENLGKFAVIGKLESSNIYGAAGQPKRYRILDEGDQTICYVMPTGTAAGKDLTDLIGKKVGVIGQIRPHEATGMALVEFTEVMAVE
jgi:uncharacterized protein YraI